MPSRSLCTGGLILEKDSGIIAKKPPIEVGGYKKLMA